jgi:hypothetical protein
LQTKNHHEHAHQVRGEQTMRAHILPLRAGLARNKARAIMSQPAIL